MTNEAMKILYDILNTYQCSIIRSLYCKTILNDFTMLRTADLSFRGNVWPAKGIRQYNFYLLYPKLSNFKELKHYHCPKHDGLSWMQNIHMNNTKHIHALRGSNYIKIKCLCKTLARAICVYPRNIFLMSHIYESYIKIIHCVWFFEIR